VSGTLIIAIVAAVFAALSSIASVVALLYSHRADERAERAERRADEQAERDAQRFEREAEDAVDRESANLTADIKGPEGSSRGRDYRVTMKNLGPAPARRLSVWFVGEGGPVGTKVGGRAALMPGETVELIPTVPTHADYSGTLHLHYEWTDGLGIHEAGSSADVPLT
jgi:hypothetical protein